MPDINNSQITDKIKSFTEHCVYVCLLERLCIRKKKTTSLYEIENQLFLSLSRLISSLISSFTSLLSSASSDI